MVEFENIIKQQNQFLYIFGSLCCILKEEMEACLLFLMNLVTKMVRQMMMVNVPTVRRTG